MLLITAWLFVFFFLRWKGRAVWTVATLLFIVLTFSGIESNHRAAFAATAARSIRDTQRNLESYASAHPGGGYPGTLAGMVPLEFPYAFYRIHYSPYRAQPGGPITGFLLTAAATEPVCGPETSFAVSENGVIHFTPDRRDATLNDPAL
jgi:hypothetical protein